ncbi:tRNA pseudouridine(38/39) synthase [Trichoplusia ni]|uniref:tRNA pseudouridine(38/39) synthase n=1 Tax=Trichoplusia ni TaxID=7111 RepID=A0A7E5WID7_TRINI|nr:tRNA pseudouridine(38/39) synthase [Trichoplusia ni]
MEKLPPKPRKTRGLDKEELMKLDKEDLVDRIIQLEAHNFQLRNIISRDLGREPKDFTKDGQRQFDFRKCNFRRVLLRVLYFGWNYNGLAVQEDNNQTIEHHLFNALIKCCLIESRETSNYHRCGRTDKGVSAFGQVISISLRTKFSIEEQNTPEALRKEMPYCKMLNRLLPKDIKVVAWAPIPTDNPEYSARFDCKKRQYKYYFPRSSLNIEAMRSACPQLLGSHDYRNLCKMDVGNGVTEFRRHLVKAEIVAFDDKDADRPTSMYYLLIEGNAFLWHQIRCIMGVLLLIGQGKESPDIITELLDVEKNPRKPQYNMALDAPLNLFHCTYELTDKNPWIYDKLELAEILMHLQGEWTHSSIQTTMIKDVIDELEKQYTLMPSETEDAELNGSDKDSIMAHSDCLIQGVKAKVYTPLLKRVKCSSLEEKIQHYKKKRKVGGRENEEVE